jgi:hypothetical protein
MMGRGFTPGFYLPLRECNAIVQRLQWSVAYERRKFRRYGL